MRTTFWWHHERTRGSTPAFLLAFACAIAGQFFSVRSAQAQNASIGLYTDPSGSTCSFSGNSGGVFSAYVVYRPDASGVNAVQFAAPVPSCLGAVYLSETLPPGMVSIGNSQTGISIALGGCYGQPVSVLKIDYFRSGSTDPCCAYPLVPDPSSGASFASNCAFEDNPTTVVASHFNADASCACIGNSAPIPPYDPDPAVNATDVGVRPQLRWLTSDSDGDIVGYDVYLGTSSSPPLVATVSEPLYSPAQLEPLTPYYWRVVVRDATGVETSGPEWTFTTRVLNLPPDPPVTPIPVDGAIGVPVYTALRWVAADIDADALTFDVYLGAVSPPPLLVANLVDPIRIVDGLEFSTAYYWRVVSRDPFGEEASGAEWSFVTRPANYPPVMSPYSEPATGATGQPLNRNLNWYAYDPDVGDTLVYDLYLGTAATPPLFASNLPVIGYVPAGLNYATQYFWQIVARDETGAEAASPVWNYTTRPENYPPNPPSSPNPTNGATGRGLNPNLTWTATDPDNQVLTFDVYFGTDTSPPLVATNVATRSFLPGPLLPLTTYRWRIVSRDTFGVEASGPTWSFTTRPNSAPSAPSSPNPSNNQHTALAPVLTWNASDPDGQPLTFDVYFGTSSPPPAVAAALSERRFEPGVLQPGTRYYWRVVASDGALSTQSAIWNFTAHAVGDANLDGQLTVADASCALGSFVGWGPCYGLTWLPIADVDCSGAMTPRDARCIHRHVLNGSCTFCNGTTQTSPALDTPAVWVSSTWEWNDTLYVRLGASGVSSFEAFGFFLATEEGQFVRARRRGVTNDFVALAMTPYPSFSMVGGYALTGSPVASGFEFLDLLFVGPEYSHVQIGDFVDDLAGAPSINFFIGGGSIPVLITSFQALKVDDGVEVHWDLRSDEAIESFTLYRREDNTALPSTIAHGPATTRSHIDASVESGKTYHYELVIRAVDGDEFRSQIATVSLKTLELALHQNHPNPFNPQTTITYDLPPTSERVHVRMWIIDISGRVVKTLLDESQGSGSHRIEWQGKDDRGESVSSGVYFYVLDAGGERRTRKLVLLK